MYKGILLATAISVCTDSDEKINLEITYCEDTICSFKAINKKRSIEANDFSVESYTWDFHDGTDKLTTKEPNVKHDFKTMLEATQDYKDPSLSLVEVTVDELLQSGKTIEKTQEFYIYQYNDFRLNDISKELWPQNNLNPQDLQTFVAKGAGHTLTYLSISLEHGGQVMSFDEVKISSKAAENFRDIRPDINPHYYHFTATNDNDWIYGPLRVDAILNYKGVFQKVAYACNLYSGFIDPSLIKCGTLYWGGAYR